MEHTISITPQAERKVTDTKSIPFGKVPTEHMFVAEYKDGEWHNAQVMPFHDLTLSPLALCLHYGQTVFEGMKAFAMEDGCINIFRIDNIMTDSQNHSSGCVCRMCLKNYLLM